MRLPNGVRLDAIDDTTTRGIRHVATVDVPFSGRMWARLFATRYDQQVEEGVRVAAGTPLAAHCARLSSRREREDMVQALTFVLRDAGLVPGGGGVTSKVPIQADVVRRSADLVHDALSRLAGPVPVRARGMARLRILLSDGRGPLYRCGPGTFAAAMRGVLAAM